MDQGLKRVPNPLAAIRLDAELDLSHCFVFDNHLNGRAHALYARKISEIILRDLKTEQ
jgi:hypothetical protein